MTPGPKAGRPFPHPRVGRSVTSEVTIKVPNTLQAPESTGVHVEEAEKKARFLRVKVVDSTKLDHPAVNIKVPIGVVKWGMKMAQAFSPQLKEVTLDWDSISAMVQEGEQGKIVDIEDEAEHKTVEVWVE